jgi:hypothetical protein
LADDAKPPAGTSTLWRFFRRNQEINKDYIYLIKIMSAANAVNFRFTFAQINCIVGASLVISVAGLYNPLSQVAWIGRTLTTACQRQVVRE